MVVLDKLIAKILESKYLVMVVNNFLDRILPNIVKQLIGCINIVLSGQYSSDSNLCIHTYLS